jgi:lipid-binding SYLF domain-containing protein
MYVLGLLLISVFALFGADQKEVIERLQNANAVLEEVMSIPEKGIPRDLLADAHCVVIVPGLKKGAFIVGAQYGKGFATCRTGTTRAWSAPAAIRVEGGSVGFQIGGEETDVIMLIMDEAGAKQLLTETKFTLGGEGSVAAGPVGRTAQAKTDAGMRAKVLSYNRARGVFAGISLAGATLRPDMEDNEALYGKRLKTSEVIQGNVQPPPAAQKLIAALSNYSRVEGTAADRPSTTTTPSTTTPADKPKPADRPRDPAK